MIESFTLGMCTAFLVRVGATKWLKWPIGSRNISYILGPLQIIPELIMGGVALSLFDYYRRIALEKNLLCQ